MNGELVEIAHAPMRDDTVFMGLHIQDHISVASHGPIDSPHSAIDCVNRAVPIDVVPIVDGEHCDPYLIYLV